MDAIAAQAVAPDQVLVVDNNSTDQTTEIARSFPFVTVLTEKRQGVVFARDKGFNQASSNLIGRIDADTILSPDWVERVKSFYDDPTHANQCLTGGCYFYNMRFGHAAGWWQGQIAFRMNRLLLGHYILFGSNMVIPKTIWQSAKAKVCDDLDVHEDLDLAIHVHRSGYPIVYQETLKVGIKMRRVFEDRHQLWDNMLWWPKTLQRHGLASWTIGWLGAAVLYIFSFLAFLVKKPAK